MALAKLKCEGSLGQPRCPLGLAWRRLQDRQPLPRGLNREEGWGGCGEEAEGSPLLSTSLWLCFLSYLPLTGWDAHTGSYCASPPSPPPLPLPLLSYLLVPGLEGPVLLLLLHGMGKHCLLKANLEAREVGGLG